MNRRILVCGAGGFIGNHLVNRLKAQGHHITGIDLKYPEFEESAAQRFILGDLRNAPMVEELLSEKFDEIYQLAADMGGAGYVFTGEHDADVMHNSASINLNVLNGAKKHGAGKIFYSSSACIYPEYNQTDPANPNCAEDSAYPAQPDSEYGWEKLFSERLYLAYARNYNIAVRIARFHNIYGPMGTYRGGREKAPAAICRKVAEAPEGGNIQIWGDGQQTRSFLYIDECLDAVDLFMKSDFQGPVNIGSEEMVSINRLAEIVTEISGKKLAIQHIKGPTGVRGRRSDNKLIKEKLGWEPRTSLSSGLEFTYNWVQSQIK